MIEEPNAARAVVVHISNAPEDVQRAINTARTLQERFPGVRVRIIANGPALTAVPTIAPDELPENVDVAVCAVGLTRHNIATADVPDRVEIVPTAPIAIIEEQFNGAAYLRL
ncbi:hypothetical protein B4U78_008785 [Microbacterium esteraromaticum]|jgi:intracellular sulfur oxidation DsrE/DsrF family protein|nr:hypothetical protein B4U78_008785 [Microbacterium esteraromaticum]